MGFPSLASTAARMMLVERAVSRDDALLYRLAQALQFHGLLEPSGGIGAQHCMQC